MIDEILKYVIPKTLELNKAYIVENGDINYSAIFCQSDEEYKRLIAEAQSIGNILKDTPTGPLFKLHKPIKTSAGMLKVLKIRHTDKTRPQRGDADFTIEDYEAFKKRYTSDSEHFSVISRENFEMIELRDQRFSVLSYFSNIPITAQFGLE